MLPFSEPFCLLSKMLKRNGLGAREQNDKSAVKEDKLFAMREMNYCFSLTQRKPVWMSP